MAWADKPSTPQDLYDAYFPAEVYSSFSRLQGFARDLNARLSFPEYVVVGVKGVGKTTLLEGLVGVPLFGPGMTNRPVHLTFVHNMACDQPRIVIKRDAFLKEFSYDQDTDLKSLPRQLAKRNKEETPLPVIVQYEHRATLNFTLIDTPGVILGDADSEATALAAMAPAHRRILAVVDASDPSSHSDVVKLLQSIDPELSRTTFVQTHFHAKAETLPNTVTCNHFLHTATTLDAPTYFVSAVPEFISAKLADSITDYRKIVWQLQARDIALLEGLAYDRTFAPRVGLHALRKSVIDGAWKAFQGDVPAVLRTLRSQKATIGNKLESVRQRVEGLQPERLRSLANSYVVEFLQVIDRLITGSSEGNPNVNGQTLEEEKEALGLGEWKSSDNDDIPIFTGKVPYYDARVYGGQQFKRLLSAFAEAAQAVQIGEAQADVISSAAGISRLNNLPNFAWAACELATLEARRSLLPLVKQLSRRAQYVVERLPGIAKQIMDNRRATKWNASQALLATDVEQYPYFAFAVQDLYKSFVRDTLKECTEKCMDEFLDTRTVYWHLAEDKQGKLPVDRFVGADAQTAVTELAAEVFGSLRARVVTAVQLKFFNFFLVPLQTKLAVGVQERANVLTDEELEQRFEVSATKTKLREDERALTNTLDTLREMEGSLLENATRFSHPSL